MPSLGLVSSKFYSAFRCFFAGAIAHVNSDIRRGKGSILFNNVLCAGDEESFFQCPNNGLGVIATYCNHGEDAGVECPGIFRNKSNKTGR